MPPPWTLAIDQGTHASRAMVFDDDGLPVAAASRPVSLRQPAAGRYEQRAEEILQATRQVIDAVLDQVDRGAVGAAGLCTQRSSVLAWDDDGRALSPVIGWQDHRADDRLGELSAAAERIRTLSGLRLSPHYGAPKLEWLTRHGGLPEDRPRASLRYGPLCGYLLRQLLGLELLDEANASRTLLWNLAERHWDPWLIACFSLRRDALPRVQPVCSRYGRLIGTRIPLTAVNGDQGAAVFGAGPPGNDELIVNLGTGGFALLPAPDPPAPVLADDSGLLTTLIRSDRQRVDVALEGTVNGAGAALAWLSGAFDIPTPERLLETALRETESPPLFVNSVGGLGSPWWRSGPPSGFPRQAPANDAAAVAAVAESVLFLLQANIDAMRSLGRHPDRIRLGGGLARSDALCQRLADLSGLPVCRPQQIEASARGIAWLAAGQPAHWTSPRGDHWRPRADAALTERYRRSLALLQRTPC